ncbi:hypothetical protein VTK73DRAFT_7119 [Phialemonium thermophilum]|uniref:Uncharacterized protein n=1 Tax=Phialemonium thermophilum TaxID=223376 RepID=A0ABR3WH46_9PEZI
MVTCRMRNKTAPTQAVEGHVPFCLPLLFAPYQKCNNYSSKCFKKEGAVSNPRLVRTEAQFKVYHSLRTHPDAKVYVYVPHDEALEAAARPPCPATFSKYLPNIPRIIALYLQVEPQNLPPYDFLITVFVDPLHPSLCATLFSLLRTLTNPAQQKWRRDRTAAVDSNPLSFAPRCRDRRCRRRRCRHARSTLTQFLLGD